MRRLAIPVDEEMFQQIKFIPTGIRAEVFRQLIRLLITTQKSNMNTYVADDILHERLVLARIDQLLPEVQEKLIIGEVEDE